MTIGDRLQSLEKILNISITQLGLDAGLGQGTTNRWMNKSIDFENTSVKQFKSFYNINDFWWKTGEGEPFNKEGISSTQLYERLVEMAEEAKLNAQKNSEQWLRESQDWKQQSAKWEAEAARLGNLLELTLKSKLSTPQ